MMMMLMMLMMMMMNIKIIKRFISIIATNEFWHRDVGVKVIITLIIVTFNKGVLQAN